jgi:hypothetical protein
VSSTSSGSSTVLDEQNRLEGVSSKAFGSGCTDESLGSSWVSNVSDLSASELGVVPDSRSFFVSDHVLFPVGATDDDSHDSAWVSADDDHEPSLVTPATLPGSTGLIDESLHSGFLFGLRERLVKSLELVEEHGGRRGKKGFFF